MFLGGAEGIDSKNDEVSGNRHSDFPTFVTHHPESRPLGSGE
jgi:hypothetical protein